MDELLINVAKTADQNTGQTRHAATAMHGQLLTLRETADILRTPVATLRYWRHLGIGPDGFRVGRRVMYRIDDLNRWITEQHDTQTNQRPPESPTADHPRRRAGGNR